MVNPAPEPTLHAIPMGAPLDWFDPVYFNTVLTLRERDQVFKKATFKIALPAAELCTREHWTMWRGMSYPKFMEKYGNDELKKYEIPSEEEIALLDEYEALGEFEPDFDPELDIQVEDMLEVAENLAEEDGMALDDE